MSMSFEEKLAMYARLLVAHGLNVQPGQFVQIGFEPHADEVAVLAAEFAYERGARHVHLSYSSPRVIHAQLTKGPESERFFFPVYERARNDQIVDAQGCYLNLRTSSEPDLFDAIPELAIEYRNEMWRMRSRFMKEGINKGLVQWCLACPPSPKAAKKVYPDLSLEDAHQAYWEAVFRMTFSDQPDCLERWAQLDRTLERRRKALDALAIRQIRFTGPGTDLMVGLSPDAVWSGGSKVATNGVPFTANVPTFEVFTTPDRRLTQGKVKITRPVDVAGVLVENLELEFRDGRIVDVQATSNKEAYVNYIQTDEGASQLGEVALVGLDSPVARESPLLREILYAENGACHIATGNGYASGLRNGWNRSASELRELGRNESKTHLDIMISDLGVDVIATNEAGEEVLLLQDGNWTEAFK